MHHLIVWLVRRTLGLFLPARGKHRAVQAPAAAVPAPAATRISASSVPAPYEPNPEPGRLYMGPLIRPHIDHDAWLTELDEMQRQYDEQQRQQERREALRTAALGLPDPGYTYPGAHALSGAVA
ncbi:hypothetical protein [Kitasatospora sp. NPDC096204]|uniref:hypothetical protein n=1 Tax=Kitasatospora sp. NPDC096204 TaxID=3364094 RepID=UPI003819CA49